MNARQTTTYNLYSSWWREAVRNEDLRQAKYWRDKLQALQPARRAVPRVVASVKVKHAKPSGENDWTQNQDAMLVKMIRAGNTYAEIGEVVGRTRDACLGRAKRKRWLRKDLLSKHPSTLPRFLGESQSSMEKGEV